MVYFISEDGRKHKEEIGTCIYTLKILQRSIKQRIWNEVLYFFVNHIQRVVFPLPPLSFVIMLFTMAKSVFSYFDLFLSLFVFSGTEVEKRSVNKEESSYWKEQHDLIVVNSWALKFWYIVKWKIMTENTTLTIFSHEQKIAQALIQSLSCFLKFLFKHLASLVENKKTSWHLALQKEMESLVVKINIIRVFLSICAHFSSNHKHFCGFYTSLH